MCHRKSAWDTALAILPLAGKMHGMAKVRVYYRGWIDYEIEDPQLIIDAVRPGPEFDRFLDIYPGESADSAARRLMNVAASGRLERFPPEVPGATIVGDEAGWMMDPEDFSDDLSRTLDDLDARPVLHHYTSGLGVKGIVENRELWATHIYYLNDRSEYQATFEHALDLLPQRVLLQERLALAPVLRDAIISQLTHYSDGRPPAIFVTCFSESHDDLSQWRGYTSPGDGYAVTFYRDRLEDIAKSAGWRLMKCRYGDSAVYRALIPTMEKLILDHTETGPDNEARAAETVAQLQHHLQDVSPYLKHDAFKSEKEWRLISPPMDDVEDTFEYRIGRSFLTPYVKFSLGELDSNTVPGITTGPGPNAGLAQNAVLTFMRQNGIHATGSVASAPYRPW